MRRMLADSTFLRVYVLLALALLLTFGLALLGLAFLIYEDNLARISS